MYVPTLHASINVYFVAPLLPSFDTITAGDDFLGLELATLMRTLAENMPYQNEGSIFRAAWRWGMASLGRMQVMPDVFKVVKVSSGPRKQP